MLEELRPLPQLLPDLKEIGFYVGSFNPMVEMVLMPFGFLLLKIAPKKGVKPPAVPVVAALMQYEEIRKPGLWMQGLIVEPVRFFDDMKRMGIQA